MSPFSILLIGLAMSTDAFAAAIGKGVAMGRPRLSDALRTGLIFGVIEAITPVLGWLLGKAAAVYVQAWDHWIAFALLLGLGLHMIANGLGKEDAEPDAAAAGNGNARSFWLLALTGLATSIDAAAIGVGLAFLEVHIGIVALVIGLCTFVMVTIGVLLGSKLGEMAGKRAEVLGGIVLIVIGAGILYEHLGHAPLAG
jgi:putative Mn2+ efflux pump MntP